MNDFLFSLNATMPVFLVIVLGWILKKTNMISEGFVSSADKLMFRIALPVLLFRDISSINIKKDFNFKFVAFCFCSTLAFILIIWLLSEIFIKDKKIIGSFVQGSFRGSAAVLGIAFAQNIYGSSGLVPMMIVASVPLFNIFSVIVLARSDAKKSGEMRGLMKDTLVGIVTNPIIIGIILGMICACLPIKFPVIIDKTMSTVGSLSTPLALVTMGAGFSLGKVMEKAKPTIVASIIKLVILPIVFLPIAIAMGFRNEALVAILILLGAPSTPSGYVMTKNMNNDYVLSSGVIVLTTLLSSISITVIIFILKNYSFI